jgi:hypothetical protein
LLQKNYFNIKDELLSAFPSKVLPSPSSENQNPTKQSTMAFFKAFLFIAFIAVATAQLALPEGLPIGGEQLGQLPELPTEGLPVGGDQLGGLPIGGGGAEAPAGGEDAGRLTQSLNRLTNGLNALRGNRRH